MNAVPHALLKAIRQFNASNLRYSWIQYLPIRPRLSDFFERLETITLQLLSLQPILECVSGELAVPHSMKYVPDSFRDSKGVPLTLCETTQLGYLSHRYASSDWPNLQRLGVGRLSMEEFLTDLQILVCKHAMEFRQKPLDWHSWLALVLAQVLTSNFHSAASILYSLPIVPLRDGQWVKPNTETLLFPGAENIVVPPGIEIGEIHPDASQDSRRHLFTLLGAQPFVPSKICDIIIKKHSNQGFRPALLSRGDLVSHAIFLYSTGWNNLSFGDSASTKSIWLISEVDTYHLGSELYIDSDMPYSATKFFERRRNKFPFLHKDYLNALHDGKMGVFTEWMVQNLSLHRLPRISSSPRISKFSLSLDFQFIIDTIPSKEVLLLIRDNWQHYAQWIEAGTSRKDDLNWQNSRDSVRRKLCSMEVQCLGGVVAQLDQTFLPFSTLPPEKSLAIPFLDVSDPDDERWKYLRHLGVVVKLGAKVFIQYLQALQRSGGSVSRATEFYKQLRGLGREEIDAIR